MIWLALLGCRPEPGFSLELDRLPGGALLAAWSDGDTLVLVGGDLGEAGTGVVARLEGSRLCVQTGAASAPLWWVHGAAPGAYTAVGARGRVVQVQSGEATEQTLPTQSTLFGVWEEGDEAWAVGGDIAAHTGEIWHRTEGLWSLAHQTEQPLFKVWGRWIAGDGVVLWRDGDGAWVDRTPPEAPRLLTLRGRSDEEVYAVGGDTGPELWRWDGAAWSTVEVSPYCAYNPLNGLWTGPDEDIWIAATFGGMGRLDAEGWTCPDAPVTTEHLHAAWRHGDATWFVGGDLMNPGGNHGVLARYGEPGEALELTTDCTAW